MPGSGLPGTGTVLELAGGTPALQGDRARVLNEAKK
jgi:hypothetical protein